MTPPPGAEIIDAAGMTVMPGLINSNQHIQLNPLYPAPTANLPLANVRARWENNWSKEPARAFWYLMQGITSMRNTSGPAAALLPVKRAIDKGEIPGPRVFLGGALFMSKEYFASYVKNTPPDAIEWMKKNFAYNVVTDVDKDTDAYLGDDFNYWKLYMSDDKWDGTNDYTDAQLRFIIDKAHKHGKIVDVHCTGNNDGLRRMLAFDIDTLGAPVLRQRADREGHHRRLRQEERDRRHPAERDDRRRQARRRSPSLRRIALRDDDWIRRNTAFCSVTATR